MAKQYENYASFQSPMMEGMGPVADRELQDTSDIHLPEDIEVISADNHWEITEDIFYENFPAHLKERAPRVWFDGYWRIGRPDVKEAFGLGENIERTLTRGFTPTAWSHDVRIKDLERDGMTKEIVFPQSLLGYVDPDPEIREWIYKVYNDYLADQQRQNPNFIGVGLCQNWWDKDKIEGAFDRLTELGIKVFMMPTKLKNFQGKEMSYADPEMEPFWEVANAAGLPLCFHVGEALNFEGRGALAAGALQVFAPFRGTISQLVFGGVFDRSPNMQVVFAEGGIGWALPWLQDAEAMFDLYGNGDLLDRIENRPSYYWHQNCSATFQVDELGLSHLDILGVDRVMWAADYPHSEGTFGFSRKAMKAVVDQIGAENGRKVLGGNAKRIFNI
ncbi:MAG: amidohydrolase family protein [Sphingomonadales bacterium]